MLESIRRGQRWLVGSVVLVIGGVFVFFMGWGAPNFSPSTSAVVELGDVRFAVSDFERTRAEREAEYRRLLGDQFDAAQAEDFLREQALGALVDRAVLSQEASELGLRVTDEELRDVLRNAPAFRDEDGRFSVEAYRSWVEYEYGREESFKRDWRTRLLATKAVELLQANVGVSEAEARMAALHDLEEVRLAYVMLDRTALPAGAEPSDEEVEAWLAENEEQARLEYDANVDAYALPEQVRVRHILFQPEPAGGDADEDARWEAARARAEEARARIEAGADFADVALEVSDDAASREAGGDLGFLPRDELAPALAGPAFELEPGTVSEPVRGEGGFHLVRVEERREAGSRAFEDVRLEIGRRLSARDAAEARARALADALSAAVGQGQDLEEAARAQGLTLGRTALIRRRPDGFIPGVGGSVEAMATAFALEPGQSSPEVFEVGDQLVLVQTLDHRVPEEEALEEATRARREQLRTQKQNSELQHWINARRSRLVETQQLLVNRDAIQ